MNHLDRLVAEYIKLGQETSFERVITHLVEVGYINDPDDLLEETVKEFPQFKADWLVDNDEWNNAHLKETAS